jgi:DNA-binding NtrC family response regulator
LNFNILIADDEEELGSSLSEIFSSKGYNSFYITDPIKVPGIITKEKINLIIMDIRMPRISGIDLLKIIKKENRSIPIIMITGYPSIESAVQAMKYGALNFYVKPLNIQKLLDEIKQISITQNIKLMLL